MYSAECSPLAKLREILLRLFSSRRLPSSTCNAGTIKVSLYGEKNDLIASSRIISGDLKVRESIKWKDDLKLTKFVSRPVSLKIDLSADAKVYAIRFDDLFWD